MKQKITYLFLTIALISLALGMFFGCVAGMQYIFPELLGQYFPFHKTRPLHVTFVLSWTILCAIAVIYYCLNSRYDIISSTKLAVVQFFLFLFTGVTIAACFSFGIFGGREYFAFSPLLSIPIIAGWVIFGFIFFRTILKTYKNTPSQTQEQEGSEETKRPLPVWLWMWGTGIIFFVITFTEAHLWLIPYFRDNPIRDITVQWKAYGGFIGSWNMLVYGTAIYVMYSIKQDEKLIYGFLPFFLYFVGLTNLIFGWGHHTYILPAQPWIRHISYFISMTELIILGIIIWNWKISLQNLQKNTHRFSGLFLFSSDLWIVLNLILAIGFSIPFINYYTHGTHITVAHAMGTTIGINTNIMLASVFFILFNSKFPGSEALQKNSNIIRGFHIFQTSFLFLWISLILSGIRKSYWLYFESNISFRDMQIAVKPYLIVFVISGIGIFIGLSMVIFPLINSLLKVVKNGGKIE